MGSKIGTAQEVYRDPTISPSSVGGGLDIIQVLDSSGAVAQANTLGGLVYGNKTTQDNITAKAGGNQGNGTPILPVTIARLTTVVNSGDAVTLPPSQTGFAIALINDGAQPANVFPSPGDQINSQGVNNSFSLATNTPTIFYCTSSGLWRTK
jgi:hypothetical protein